MGVGSGMTPVAFSDLDPSLRDEVDDFGGQFAGAVEARPLFARLLDAVVDDELPGEWGAGSEELEAA